MSEKMSAKKFLKRGDRLELSITSINEHGAGLASNSENEVVVSGAFPGEQVEVEVLARSKHHPRAFARLLNLKQRHPSRRQAMCEHHDSLETGKCTGCPLMEVDVPAQRQSKEIWLKRSYGLEIDSWGGDSLSEEGYRFSAKRVVASYRDEVVLGSFIRGSHRVADMRNCVVDHPSISRAARELQEQIKALDVPVFQSTGGKKLGNGLRYVWFKSDGDEVLLTLISSGLERDAVVKLATALQIPAGVAWSEQSAEGNAIRGNEATVLAGRSELEKTLAGVDVSIGPLGFLQPNPEVISEAYRALLKNKEGENLTGQLALDLYAGAGVTTSLLRSSFQEVLPFESYPESAARLGIVPCSSEEGLRSVVASNRDVDLVIANPPRKGMGEEACSLLEELSPARIHIMSCGPAALKKDLKKLDKSYRLVSLQAFDTLPMTAHVELVARLEKRTISS